LASLTRGLSPFGPNPRPAPAIPAPRSPRKLTRSSGNGFHLFAAEYVLAPAERLGSYAPAPLPEILSLLSRCHCSKRSLTLVQPDEHNGEDERYSDHTAAERHEITRPLEDAGHPTQRLPSGYPVLKHWLKLPPLKRVAGF